MNIKLTTTAVLAVLLLYGCTEESLQLVKSPEDLHIVGEISAEMKFYDGEGPHDHHRADTRTSGFTETFESGSKPAYAAGNVSLSSGSWHLSDALIGTLSSDRKYNSKSVRVRNSGYAIMQFDMDDGVSIVKVRHAKFGSNGSSSWRLIASYDNGTSWVYAGSAVNTTSTSLQTVTFDVNRSGSVRYGVQKISGGSNRINIDNFEVSAEGSAEGSDGGSNGESATKDNHLTFGNPSNASSSSNNYLVSRSDYALSYNNSRGTANWVSWHLSSAWIGSASRCNCFKRDTSLPSSFFRATHSDYTGSGFDRGHFCPSADRTYSSNGNRNTFYMTNVAPQAPDNNQRSWASLEAYCRTLASQGKELHIVAGVAGSGGTGRNGFENTIDGGNITVPDSFWKVILVLPNGSGDISRVTTATRMIAVNIPNDQGISHAWGNFRTSVNDIESLTGYDLFASIPNSVESVLESQVDSGPTN